MVDGGWVDIGSWEARSSLRLALLSVLVVRTAVGWLGFGFFLGPSWRGEVIYK